jgi:hypothetical protein
MPAPHRSAIPVAADDPVACLDALADALHTLGWVAHVTTASSGC